MTDPLSAETISRALGGKRNGSGWKARCPAHDDRNPSLSINADADGRPLLHCHAGCSQEAVIEALRGQGIWPERAEAALDQPTGQPEGESPPPASYPGRGPPRARWIYRDRSGRPVMAVYRFERPDGKDILPMHWDGSRWVTRAHPKPRPLYNLDQLLAYPESPAIVTEGERAATAASKLAPDWIATTSQGGSKAAGQTDWSPLRGRRVVVWPDADEPGQSYAREAASEARRAGAGSVTVMDPFELREFPPSGWDAADALHEGILPRFVAEAIDRAHEPETQSPSRRFQLIKASDLKVREPQWLIRGLLEKDSLATLFGDPATYKSFLAIDWACCVASARDFRNHKIACQGPVIYLAGEGQNGLARRLKAWCIRQNESIDDLDLYLSNGPAALCDAASAAEVTEAVDDTAQATGSPVLVVVDTLARNFGPGDENSTEDMAAVIGALDRLRADHGCTVLLIHHTGHHDKSRARGAMALKGALDAEYRVDKDELGTVRLEATKMKEAPDPEPLAFKPRKVELGFQDSEGEEVTSVVLDPTSYEPPARTGKEGCGKWQTKAIELLSNLYKDCRARLEESGHDPETARVSVDEWKDACLDSGMEYDRFRKVKPALEKQGIVTIQQGFVWPV